MAEFNSRQAAKIAAGTKLLPSEGSSKVKTVIMTTPATAAWAQNDTIVSGVRIPAGARFLASSIVSHEAFTTSVTLEVGIRNWVTKAVIDADGIAAAVSIASAGRTAINNGALVAAGVDSVTTVDCEVYCTLTGANPTDNAQLRLEVNYTCPD